MVFAYLPFSILLFISSVIHSSLGFIFTFMVSIFRIFVNEAAAEISLKLVYRYYQLVYRFLAKGRLFLVSRQSHLSAIYKDDNQMIPEVVHRSPGIYIRADENPEISHLGDRLLKNAQQVFASF